MKKLILNIALFLGIALSVTAQNVYIPDANFKAYLLGRTDSINTNKDTVISVQEAVAFNGRISFGNIMGNGELTGIEKFINLTYLDCNVSGLKTLDVSKNINLTYLSCDRNSISNLDLSNNIKLVTLDCSSNKISNLNVSLNTNLKEIDCGHNIITSLDLSKNINLTSITCYDNPLGTLDISKNTSLTYLYCTSNNLSNLDVSNNTSLTFLEFSGNSISSLDVNKNKNLTELYCSYNILENLNVSNNTNLISLVCINNNLKYLDISKNSKLISMASFSNPLLTTICVQNIAFAKSNFNIKSSTPAIEASYSQQCNERGDFQTSPISLQLGIINIDTTITYQRGRNIASNCKTSAKDTNTIDAYYTFVANNSSTSLDLTVGNPAWLSTMELLDTLTFSPISNTCQSNVGVGQTTRTYNFTGLTVGQKYLVRLELGDVAPLGHARMEAVNNTFSVKLNSTVTDVSDNTISSNKTISNIYNIQGLEVSKDFRGLVIYKYSDGTTQKVVQE